MVPGNKEMAQEEHLQSKLINILRIEGVHLWSPPYTSNNNEAGPAVKELAERLASKLGHDFIEVEKKLEEIRVNSVQRGEAKRIYKSTGVGVLIVILSSGFKQDRKKTLSTEMNITGKQLISKIAELCNTKESCIKLTVNGRLVNLEKTLDEQNIKHNAKVYVIKLMLSEEEAKKEAEKTCREQVEGKKNVQKKDRIKKGLEILSLREEYVDPDIIPCLEIADQTGKPIKIPPDQKKALVLAMGLHEKGRSLLKRKQYDMALLLLVEADEHFCKCGEDLLNTVDNYAVLQLDIVWCYVQQEQLSALEDAEKKLKRCKECFEKCYGTGQERLFNIKGSSGSEKVLFLRLHLLYGILHYLKGDGNRSYTDIKKAEELYRELYVDNSSVTILTELGYTEQEARLALRACDGDVNNAAEHIQRRREEKAAIKHEEREKRRHRNDAINTLAGMGFSKHAAAVALSRANGDLDKAFQVLLDNPDLLALADPETSTVSVSPESIEKLVYLGFDCSTAESALRQFRGNIHLATQYLARYRGNLPSGLFSPSMDHTASMEPASSENSHDSAAAESSSHASEESDLMDTELVEEIIADIPEHEEDYLDLTLEEEAELIAKYKSYIENSQTAGT
ncbi:NEDD8 ultimate buster 1 isoform X2 [Protopterus annectens]|uniref:NEDD8 ultimate buster 1 isoform X2 n=1 Tax=Protopterus annectens TaxID=7888 RepID=UPI001CFC4313|nr:NEDD8 ultimate buster 1 isoform X2 [Protopterus annectens]